MSGGGDGKGPAVASTIKTILILIVFLSSLGQIGAAWIALRQMANGAGRYRFAWGCISVALALMVERRAAPLWRMLQGESANALDSIVGLGISLLMFIGVWGLRQLFVELRRQSEDLARLARTDVLTGLPNRREIMMRAQSELERSVRTGRSVSLLVLDLDHFKTVNDNFGHAVGDAVLRAAAAAGTGSLRRIDALGRIGGEEFLAVLPETDGTHALAAAERLRLAIGGTRMETDQGLVSISVSIGVITHVPHGQKADLLEKLLVLADAALYAAKASGRNRVVSVPEADCA